MAVTDCNAHVPRSGSDPAPRSRGHGITVCAACCRFPLRPGDHLKLPPPLSRLHRPLKIPHSAVAHTAVLARKGEPVRSWELFSGSGTTHVINSKCPLSGARESTRPEQLEPPPQRRSLNGDDRQEGEGLEATEDKVQRKQETGLLWGKDGDCAGCLGDGGGRGEDEGNSG